MKKVLYFLVLCRKVIRKYNQILFNYAQKMLAHFWRRKCKLSHDKICVSIKINGGIGDALMALPLIEFLVQKLPKNSIYNYYGLESHYNFIYKDKGIFSYLGPHDLYSLTTRLDCYDLSIEISHFPILRQLNLKKFLPHPEALAIAINLVDFSNKFSFYTETFPNSDHQWSRFCIQNKLNRISGLFYPFNKGKQFTYPVLNVERLCPGLLENVGLVGTPYITVNNGSDSAYNFKQTKSYPLEKWHATIQKLHNAFPNIKIVQIGHIKTSDPIIGVDVNLLGKTNLTEVAVILKNALLHIDIESGLVHINHAVGGKSIVLFGPTPEKYYGYKENVNIVSKKCSDCMWLMPTWQSSCVRGLKDAECMSSISEDSIVDACRRILG